MSLPVDAHFLHVRKGLDPVLRPPVQHPTALAWIPRREELLVADREGTVHHVDPILGTRAVCSGVGEAAVLAVHPDRTHFLVLGRGGRWLVGDLGGRTVRRGTHPFLGGMGGFFWREYLVMAGDEVDGRSMVVVRDGAVRSRARLPKRVIPMVDSRDVLSLARASAAGLQVIRFGKGARFESIPQTEHRIRATGGHVLGLTMTGVCVWERDGGAPSSLRLPELTAGDVYRDGQLLGLGTRTGAVALARVGIRTRGERPDLVRAFEAPVTTVAFSTRGRWLATGADGLQLWTWED